MNRFAVAAVLAALLIVDLSKLKGRRDVLPPIDLADVSMQLVGSPRGRLRRARLRCVGEMANLLAAPDKVDASLSLTFLESDDATAPLPVLDEPSFE